MEEHKPYRFTLGVPEVCLLWKGKNCMIKGGKDRTI